MRVWSHHDTGRLPAEVRAGRTRAGSRTARRVPHRASRPGWIAILLAALLALTWQSFVTQTHEHLDFRVNTSASDAKSATQQLNAARSPANSSRTCPICSEMALAGHYLMPVSIAFDPPRTVTHWLVLTPSLALVLHLRSHAWQSRAPPLQLPI